MSKLPLLPSDWARALVIVAHPDDIEYGLASAVKAWTVQGKKVSYLLLTHGEAGINGMEPAVAAKIRTDEQHNSAAVVGVNDVTFLDFSDGILESNLGLRAQIVGVIRAKQPEMVIVFNHYPTWPGGSLNTADHRAAGEAAIAAVQSSSNRWIFTDQSQPWDGIRYLAICSPPIPTHAIDITKTLPAGVDSLNKHTQYLAALRPQPDVHAMLHKNAQHAGVVAGLELAVTFELHYMQ